MSEKPRISRRDLIAGGLAAVLGFEVVKQARQDTTIDPTNSSSAADGGALEKPDATSAVDDVRVHEAAKEPVLPGEANPAADAVVLSPSEELKAVEEGDYKIYLETKLRLESEMLGKIGPALPPLLLDGKPLVVEETTVEVDGEHKNILEIKQGDKVIVEVWAFPQHDNYVVVLGAGLVDILTLYPPNKSMDKSWEYIGAKDVTADKAIKAVVDMAAAINAVNISGSNGEKAVNELVSRLPGYFPEKIFNDEDEE